MLIIFTFILSYTVAVWIACSIADHRAKIQSEDEMIRSFFRPRLYPVPKTIQPTSDELIFVWRNSRFSKPPEQYRVLVQIVARTGVDIREARWDGTRWILFNLTLVEDKGVDYWTFMPSLPPR